MPFSARKNQRRIEDMAKIIDKVKNDLLSSDVMSTALDESADAKNMDELFMQCGTLYSEVKRQPCIPYETHRLKPIQPYEQQDLVCKYPSARLSLCTDATKPIHQYVTRGLETRIEMSRGWPIGTFVSVSS
ncbi:hypothetical protein NPIL_188621 [Nephila pilipes]|uniref:Uncharacterized protein n=1 Tax=Nephila pilipes TaxID=299642 RepID=A0A8X6U5F8_NEPPI|nr:hypothetical protein NPIL_188621 [Nephila pilipes]